MNSERRSRCRHGTRRVQNCRFCEAEFSWTEGGGMDGSIPPAASAYINRMREGFGNEPAWQGILLERALLAFSTYYFQSLSLRTLVHRAKEKTLTPADRTKNKIIGWLPILTSNDGHHRGFSAAMGRIPKTILLVATWKLRTIIFGRTVISLKQEMTGYL